jgi:DNA helicase II / ATP-dependent DNA helicase PcrA
MPKDFILATNETTPPIDFDGALNAEQLAVVKGADGPSLVISGAGSGKTRTIIYRVAYLLSQGVSADEILLLTFTNKAAREMLSRVEELLGAMPGHLTGGTFHHVCNILLRRYAPLIGFKNNFTILDQEDSRDLINVCIKDAGIDTKQKRFPSASVLQSLWSFGRNARMPFAEVVEFKAPRLVDETSRMEGVIFAYETRKKNANAMDFDDLLVRTTDLLRQNPPVREKVAGKYRYVLVDEYQDTNRVQAEFLSLISSVHNNLLVVGDDAQSIYSFRAADIKNILSFPERYLGAKIFKLETNYRSVPSILDLANESIRCNENQFPKQLRSAMDNEQWTMNNGQPNLVTAASAEEEAEFICAMIEKMRKEGTPLSEISVLFRATFHSQALEFELTKRGLAYDYRGGIRFFERAHIKDVLSFLRIHDNPADEAAWLRVLRLQTGIGTETAAKIFSACRDFEKLDEALSAGAAAMSDRAKGGWNDFLDSATAVLKAEGSPSLAIRAIVKSAYGDYLENEFPNADERREDLEQLALFAEKYASIGAFLADSALTEGFNIGSAGGGAGDGEEKIVLSTIHQAKGLEWDAVFVIHLYNGAFPHARAYEEDAGLEEERRLFYVAATRARKKLFLSYPLTGGRGEDYLHEISPFLRELPDTVYDEIVLHCASVPGTTVFKDDFFEDEEIDVDDLSSVIPGDPAVGGGARSSFGRSTAGRQSPHSKDIDWKKKSFLGDY